MALCNRSSVRNLGHLVDWLNYIGTELAHILEYRNDELLIKNSQELHGSSESAREIATAAKAEQEAVAFTLAKAQKVTSLVKILAFVAMLYLPASLIAVRNLFFGWWCYLLFVWWIDHNETTHLPHSLNFQPDSTSLPRKGCHDW